MSIPTVEDRLVQQALRQVLEPLFAPEFSSRSYDFRPGRSAHQAVRRAREYVAAGGRWVSLNDCPETWQLYDGWDIRELGVRTASGAGERIGKGGMGG